jgi:hypothetical protein
MKLKRKTPREIRAEMKALLKQFSKLRIELETYHRTNANEQLLRIGGVESVWYVQGWYDGQKALYNLNGR